MHLWVCVSITDHMKLSLQEYYLFVCVDETSLLPLWLEELQQHGICVQPLRYRLGHLTNRQQYKHYITSGDHHRPVTFHLCLLTEMLTGRLQGKRNKIYNRHGSMYLHNSSLDTSLLRFNISINEHKRMKYKFIFERHSCFLNLGSIPFTWADANTLKLPPYFPPKTSNVHSKCLNAPYLKIVHAVRERDDEAGVVVDGLVTENDVHSVVEVPEIVLGRRQLAAVVLWVVPLRRKMDKLRYRMCSVDRRGQRRQQEGRVGRQRGDRCGERM